MRAPKTFKRFGRAKRYADKLVPEPGYTVAIIKVARLYIVDYFSPIDSLEIINPNGTYTGTVTVRHLERLGNANHAKPGAVGMGGTEDKMFITARELAA